MAVVKAAVLSLRVLYQVLFVCASVVDSNSSGDTGIEWWSMSLQASINGYCTSDYNKI